jgi:ParB-like chromosome segregation protein Spo0J
MPKPNPALLPRPALFDVTIADSTIDRGIERIPLEELELAPNARRDISEDGIERLAAMLCRTGQLIPCIGHRPNTDGPVLIYDGQRRYLAAKASQELAGNDGYEGLSPIRSLIVLLLDHEPSADEIRRIQAQANQREQLSLVDQQEQFRDCWQARAGMREEDRIAAVCADLGISARRAHNLRRQLTLPDEIRARIAQRPAGEELSVTMANRLADMYEIAPQLTEAVAKRITTDDLHDKALKDMGAFVHRTAVEDLHTYAVRIDDGALLDGAEQVDHARLHLAADGRRQITALLGCEADKLDRELDTLAARARTRALKIRITTEIRDRARNGRYAYVHDRGQDFAAAIWVVDPAFMIDLVHQELKDDTSAPAREEAYFAGARLDDEELRDAAAADEQRRAQARARHAEATRSNLGLGHDIRAGLLQPTDAQLQALRRIVCRLLVRHYGELIAYGAGWTDPERQQPVGDTGRHEPRHPDAIIDAELQRALEDPDPLRGIAQLTARLGAALTLDPAGVTRTKTLGTDRMARKIGDALPGGDSALRASVWELMRPMLSPALVSLNRDAFVVQGECETTVDLAGREAASSLDDLDLDELNSTAA